MGCTAVRYPGSKIALTVNYSLSASSMGIVLAGQAKITPLDSSPLLSSPLLLLSSLDLWGQHLFPYWPRTYAPNSNHASFLLILSKWSSQTLRCHLRHLSAQRQSLDTRKILSGYEPRNDLHYYHPETSLPFLWSVRIKTIHLLRGTIVNNTQILLVKMVNYIPGRFFMYTIGPINYRPP